MKPKFVFFFILVLLDSKISMKFYLRYHTLLLLFIFASVENLVEGLIITGVSMKVFYLKSMESTRKV